MSRVRKADLHDKRGEITRVAGPYCMIKLSEGPLKDKDLKRTFEQFVVVKEAEMELPAGVKRPAPDACAGEGGVEKKSRAEQIFGSAGVDQETD